MSDEQRPNPYTGISSGERNACPICGGRIQATREEYLDRLTLSADCQDVVNDGTWCGVDDPLRIYCENDHTHEDMIEACASARA